MGSSWGARQRPLLPGCPSQACRGRARSGRDFRSRTSVQDSTARSGSWWPCSNGSARARALGAGHLPDDPRFASAELRSEHREALHRQLEDRLLEAGSRYWIRVLNAAGVPCGPIYRVDEVFADPQAEHLGMARPVPHSRLGDLTLVGPPLRLSRAPDAPFSAGARTGAAPRGGVRRPRGGPRRPAPASGPERRLSRSPQAGRSRCGRSSRTLEPPLQDPVRCRPYLPIP